MQRIATATRAVDLFGVGKHGFKDGNIPLGILPTDFEALFCNQVQEELVGLIEGAGINPSNAVATQVAQAIKRLAGVNLTTVTFALSPFALTADHAGVVLVDCIGGNVVLNLPLANVLAVPIEYVFAMIGATANTATGNRAGTNTIEGSPSFLLSGQYSNLTIRSNAVDTWLRLAATGANVSIRNRIVNGDCTYDQLRGGVSFAIAAGAARSPTIEMFYAYCTGANATGQQITAADGTKRYRFTGAAGVTLIEHDTAIDDANSVDLAGKTATFSVKLSNSLLTAVNWQAFYANSANNFGTRASPARTNIANGAFVVGAAEALFSAQIAIPAAATTGIEIVLSVGAQVSGTWTIGEMQLKEGATPIGAIVFDRVPAAETARQCQTRYQTSYNYGVMPGTAGLQNGYCAGSTSSNAPSIVPGVQFKSTMAAVPAIVNYHAVTGNPAQTYRASDGVAVGMGSTNIGTSGVGNFTLSVASSDCYFHHYTASARLLA